MKKSTQYDYEKDIEKEQSIDEAIDNNELTSYDFSVFYNTYNLSTLLKWWSTKRIFIPLFQRSYVWDLQKASEFVDTILRGLPSPSLFFYDDRDNNRYLIVDGRQRLQSLYDYIETKKFNDKTFKLVGNIHSKWKNKSYDELDSEDRENLTEALMNITIIRQLRPDDGQSSMYLAFQRLNTGGISLNAQEIRMSVSYGPLAEYLYEISADTKYDKWPFLRTKAQKNNNNFSRTQEFFLKFFAYFFMYPEFTGSSTRSMIDEFFSQQKDFDNPMKRKPNITYHSKEEFETAFNAVLDIILSLSLDDISPFDKPTQTYLEAIWVGLTYRKLILQKEIDLIRIKAHIKNWKSSMTEKEFDGLFKARRTSSTKSAKERIKAGIDYFSGDF